MIGDGIKEAFFGDQNPIGKHIKIDEMKFRVIGVLENKGNSWVFLALISKRFFHLAHIKEYSLKEVG